MSRHRSLKILAFYVEGTLRPRRASRIASHLAGCSLCTGHVEGLRQMPLRLSSIAFPPIPEHLSYRIEMAIAAESTTRVTTAEPLSGEASRRDLPARGSGQGGAGQERRRFRIPLVSSPLAGSLAAVGAAVIIAGGGYEVATHLGSTPAGTSSSASAPHKAPQAQSGAAAGGGSVASGAVQAGPRVQFLYNGKKYTISSVVTSTNFLPATLRTQAQGAMQSARLGSAKANPNAFGTPLPTATNTSQRLLAGCVSDIAAGRKVLLVDIAKYESRTATIIVVGISPSGPGVVYAVGPACSATNADVLAQQNLPRTAP